jgi:lipoprotein-anchoring transpeptidase ErfK/SrfK
MAFQKWKGLPATTVVDTATAIALNTERCFPAAGRTGDFFEVDKAKQIAFVVRGGKVQHVFNVSTGNGKSYDEEDQKNAGTRVIGVAITPTGTFRTYREHDTPRYEGDLGTLYRPKFVIGGVAVHGAPRVPNYPASHGCIRVANPVMDLIWGQNLLPLRSTVWIHD